METLHPIQMDILKKLLFSKQLRYSEVKPKDMEGALFKYHLDILKSQKLVIKKSSGEYSLTSKGKEYANRMHTISVRMKDQPKLTTIFCCVDTTSNPYKYLLHTRKKNPFYNCQGFPTTKVWFGEKVEDAAKRGLYEETNLRGKGELFAIRHYHVFKKNKDLVEDKVMYAYRFINPTGKLRSKKDGKFYWVKENDVKKVVKKPLEEFEEVFQLLKDSMVQGRSLEPTEMAGKQSLEPTNFFREVEHYTEKF